MNVRMSAFLLCFLCSFDWKAQNRIYLHIYLHPVFRAVGLMSCPVCVWWSDLRSMRVTTVAAFTHSITIYGRSSATQITVRPQACFMLSLLLSSHLPSSPTCPLLSLSSCHFISFFPLPHPCCFFPPSLYMPFITSILPFMPCPLLFSLTLTPHPWPPLLHLSFIFSSLPFSSACIASSPLFVILLLSPHLSSSSSPSSPLFAILHLFSSSVCQSSSLLSFCLSSHTGIHILSSLSPLLTPLLLSHSISSSLRVSSLLSLELPPRISLHLADGFPLKRHNIQTRLHPRDPSSRPA